MSGPMLIFDKSVLQALNVDESVWLESFYMTNITPMFFVETLADLEKEIRRGRTPEDVVGALARKTPDMNSYSNVHHRSLLWAELVGAETVKMDGRPILGGGQTVEMAGKTGIMFKVAPETEAFQRWQKREFLELERQLARQWRKGVADLDFTPVASSVRRWFSIEGKPRSLSEARILARKVVRQPNPEAVLRFCLALLVVPADVQARAVARWTESGKPSIEEFYPYFTYVAQVDLVFYIGIAADLISGERKSNRIDMAYLYYLPFCSVFVSGDHLHRKLVPLFLRDDQSYVELDEFKNDLAALDRHYDQLPDDVKARGTMHFASHPPSDQAFLVTRLWDRHLPAWRRSESGGPELRLSKEKSEELSRHIKDFLEKAQPTDQPVTSDSANTVAFQRTGTVFKGRWRRLPPEVEQAGDGVERLG